MIFNEHLEIPDGAHALFGASQHAWVRYSEEKALDKYYKTFVPSMGTVLHAYAALRIENRTKMNFHEKNAVLTELLKSGIPSEIINIDTIMANLVPYVNDSIGFHLQPEVRLKFSDIFFGTADAINYFDRKKLLRIHDYKSGEIIASMEQLEVYAALFFMEYNYINVRDTDIELRIYQNGEIMVGHPEKSKIVEIMEQMKRIEKIINSREELA